MQKHVSTKDHGDGIVQLTIDDPAQDNRLTEALCDELLVTLDTTRRDPTLKVLLLAGRPDVFCGGGTLAMLQSVAAGNVDAKDLLLPERLIAFPVPVIAAVAGHAVGAGLILALCCDIVVAAEGKRYGANFADLGFTPGLGATYLLPALVGHQLASEMIYTAKYYKGRELKGRGLFAQVVADPDVLPTALELARSISDKPRHVLELLKDTLGLPRQQALQTAMSREHLMHRVCFARPETADRIASSYVHTSKDPPAELPGHGA